jgi:single-strand DNA-binding protein
MTKFRLAVDRQQGVSGVDFMDIIAWRRLAEVCSDRLKKGQLVLVEGRIQIRSFEDQTGQRRWATEIVARDVQMLDKPKVAPSVLDESVDDIELASDLPF